MQKTSNAKQSARLQKLRKARDEARAAYVLARDLLRDYPDHDYTQCDLDESVRTGMPIALVAMPTTDDIPPEGFVPLDKSRLGEPEVWPDIPNAEILLASAILW